MNLEKIIQKYLFFHEKKIRPKKQQQYFSRKFRNLPKSENVHEKPTNLVSLLKLVLLVFIITF